MLLFVVFLTCFLYGCAAPDEAEQQEKELKREALKLEMGQELNPIDPEGHIELGKIYHQLGEHEKAIESFQTAISLDDKHPHAYNNLGLVYIDLRFFYFSDRNVSSGTGNCSRKPCLLQQSRLCLQHVGQI
jgi:tetratricopeptide (TPR) repeat protein